MNFLKAYHREFVLWYPTNLQYKDELKKANGWSRLTENLSRPVKELKKMIH